jgi:SAM-dependent methyltransferase
MSSTEKVAYSENRRRPEKAASYNVKYETKLHKRVSDRREKRLLAAILDSTGRHERLLDVPSGAGRLSGVLSRYADRIYEVDYAREMLKLCRANARGYEPRVAAASALTLPFADRSFDLVASVRLSHHLPDRARRLEHLGELLRVSRRYVLFTFFDSASLKNRLRELRRSLGAKVRSKWTLRREDVEDLARGRGFVVKETRSLSRLFSGHTFALLERAADR